VARDEYIVKFYEELYKLPPQAPENAEGRFEHFLRRGYSESPGGADALLTVDERDRLEVPLL
jgi:hypothetical protein